MSTNPVMWLLNHSTLRAFELAELRRAGITEIFTPKTFPHDEGNLSATVDWALDETLSLAADELACLNRQDWYQCEDLAAWEVANRIFRVAFIGFFPRQIETVLSHFKGLIVIRVFGLAAGSTYSELMREHLSFANLRRLQENAGRVWFAMAYEHLAEVEEEFFRARSRWLPVGLADRKSTNDWEGSDPRLLFVCPRIGSSPYYRGIYEQFKGTFGDLPHAVAGAQPIAVDEPQVLGFLPAEQHHSNLRQMRAMYYHSTEPRHVHYHPFEAIQAGMPLIYLAGGLLDRNAPPHLPGRCRNLREARSKAERLLAGDRGLMKAIRDSQSVLLEPMLARNCSGKWQENFAAMLDGNTRLDRDQTTSPERPIRIAVIVPVGYRGGSLRGAKMVAHALLEGAKRNAARVEVVFGHLDDATTYSDREFADLDPKISRRPFLWRTLDGQEAACAIKLAGSDAGIDQEHYAVPDDGMAQFCDCSLWVIISDRLSLPLLPVRPYVMMVYDYLQRYVDFLDSATGARFLAAQHAAERVWVTTRFAHQDARDWAGISSRGLRLMPMLCPSFEAVLPEKSFLPFARRKYFIWTTNLALHKNHAHAAEALAIYYETLGGALDCFVTGVNTDRLLSDDQAHLKALRELTQRSHHMRKRLKLRGELPEAAFRALLSEARFLWHPALIDNGTFSVLEAAWLGVPALSSDYPAMREIAVANALSTAWMDPRDPQAMALALKEMEEKAEAYAAELPSKERLGLNSVSAHCEFYWREAASCL